MLHRRHLIAAALGTTAAPAFAQPFPGKPVTLTVPYPPGGPADAMARVLAEILGERLGQPVVTENRAGAGGQIAGTTMLRRPPDGHSLLMADNATLGINKALYPSFAYDPLTDIAPVAPLLLMPMVLLVPQTSPFATFADLIATARARPLNYASQGAGSIGHLLGEMLRSDARLTLNHVPYQGSAPAMTALLGGQVDLLFDGIGPGLQHLRGDRLRALAVAGPSRLPLIPDVPTTAEGGLGNVSLPLWLGVVAASGVPRPVVERLHEEVAYAAAQPRFADRFTGLGFQPMRMSLDEFAAFVRREAGRSASIVRENRISFE